MNYYELLARYEKAMAKIEELKDENSKLKGQIKENNLERKKILDQKVVREENKGKVIYEKITRKWTNEEKMALFLELFQGREDVCAKRWKSSQTGKVGYSPYCRNEWKDGLCNKRKGVRCISCTNSDFVKLDNHSLRKHFRGVDVLGVYPMNKQDECKLIVIDFDKAGWQEEIKSIIKICRENEIPAYVERSRSGEGGHIWIFFAQWIKAAKARKFACGLLDKVMQVDTKITFEAYDRLIPSQDFVDKGGLGNLVALPLQGEARARGNSLFLDEKFMVIEDQWSYMAEIKRLQEKSIDIFFEANISRCSNAERKGDDKQVKALKRDFPEKISIKVGPNIQIPKKGISARGIVFLRQKAAYLNPEFFSKQAMRKSTYGTPRMVVVYEEDEEWIVLPIGILEEVVEELEEIGIDLQIIDRQTMGRFVEVEFKGELKKEQLDAFNDLKSYNNGVLSATTGFGKTVIGAKMIGERKCATLILVHTKELALQWIERLEQFLMIKPDLGEEKFGDGQRGKSLVIGQLGGGKKAVTGRIDVALMQSMFEKNKTVKPIIKDYGMVIVDECHHVSSASFRRILGATKAKYIYGLSATPIRKDGHHPIIFMHCGPIRHKVDAKRQAQQRPFEHYFIPRFSSCRKPLYQKEKWHISDLMKYLCENRARNQLIVADVDDVIAERRNPIILTERSSHIDILKQLMKDKPYKVIELSGKLRTKERQEALAQIQKIEGGEPVVIIATGKLIGEGFDMARLDTLFLAMPISWKGRVSQYAGRLHREYSGKTEVRIYDYIDIHIGIAEKMYAKRLNSYKSIGYRPKMTEQAEEHGNGILGTEDYFEHLLADMSNCRESMIISSPLVQKNKYNQIKEALLQRYNAGVRVAICIKKLEEYAGGYRNFMVKIVAELLASGVDVIQLTGNQHHFSIFDGELVWYGTVHLLATNKQGSSVLRIKNAELANQLMGRIAEERSAEMAEEYGKRQ